MPNAKCRMPNLKAMLIAVSLLAVIIPVAAAYTVNGAGIETQSGAAKRFVGVNIPYLLFLEKKDINSAFKEMKKAGVNAARIYASFNGDKSYAFQKKPGVYNEKMFKKLDYAVSKAAENKVSVIIVLMDNSGTYGGKNIYKKWVEGTSDDVFFKDTISREYFKKYIKKFLNRTNTVTGKKYRLDSAILGWDICNEVNDTTDEKGSVLYGWIDEMSSYLKKKDSKHLVIIGTKKMNLRPEGVNNYDIFRIKNIDAVFYDLKISSRFPASTAERYIKYYNKDFYDKVNKPLILSISDRSGGAASNITSLSESFFSENGSVIIFNYAGFGSYSKYAGAYNFSDPSVVSGFKQASSFAAKIKKTVPGLKISGISVSEGSKSASITFSTSKSADIEVLYGTELPLKDSVKGKASGVSGKVKIDNLSPGTGYKFIIRAFSGKAAGISRILSFKTRKVKRVRAIEFKTSSNFIKAKGTKFYDGSREYRYLGTSNYYLRHVDGGHKKIDFIISEVKRTGMKVLRINSHGEAISMDAIDKQGINRFFRIGPDYFNEDAFKELDYCLDSASRQGMRLILHFTDNWEYYGGVPIIAKWAGVVKNAFWTNETAKKYYKQSVKSLVMRKNTVNGKLYRDDPAIFAWDLLNEPRNEADPTGKALTAWIDEMSTYIKSLDKNHMVTTGMEGFHLKADGTHWGGTDFIEGHKPPNIDFCTYHVYPASPYNHFSMSTTKWLFERWVNDAHNKIGKPVVMEEYGITGGMEEYPKAEWIDFMTKTFYSLGGNGANYWMFVDPDYAWGDGNHFSSNDTEIVNVFIKYANKLNKNGY